MKDIPNHPNYRVSPKGVIRSKKTNRYLKPNNNTSGYPSVTLDGKTVRVHRVVAEVFIPNPNNLECVNHINGDKEDNHMDNLEWCTRSENNRHARETGLHRPGGKKKPFWMKRNGEAIKKYNSAVEAFKDGFHPSTVSACLNGRKKTYKGYEFKYANSTTRQVSEH